MLATALIGMVVVPAHQRMVFSQKAVDDFMELNLNKIAYKALDVWNENIILANVNFYETGKDNVEALATKH